MWGSVPTSRTNSLATRGAERLCWNSIQRRRMALVWVPAERLVIIWTPSTDKQHAARFVSAADLGWNVYANLKATSSSHAPPAVALRTRKKKKKFYHIFLRRTLRHARDRLLQRPACNKTELLRSGAPEIPLHTTFETTSLLRDPAQGECRNTTMLCQIACNCDPPLVVCRVHIDPSIGHVWSYPVML